MVPCEYETNRDQVWEFEHYTDQYFETIIGNRSIESQYKEILSILRVLKSRPTKSVTTTTEGNLGNKTAVKTPE